MCRWFSVSSMCSSVWSIRNVRGIFFTVRSEFISAHFTSSGKTSTSESAPTMGKCKFNKCCLNDQNSAGSNLIMNLKPSALQDPQPGHTWCESAAVTQLASCCRTLLYALVTKYIRFCSTRTPAPLQRHSNHLHFNSDVESGAALDF